MCVCDSVCATAVLCFGCVVFRLYCVLAVLCFGCILFGRVRAAACAVLACVGSFGRGDCLCGREFVCCCVLAAGRVVWCCVLFW